MLTGTFDKCESTYSEWMHFPRVALIFQQPLASEWICLEFSSL